MRNADGPYGFGFEELVLSNMIDLFMSFHFSVATDCESEINATEWLCLAVFRWLFGNLPTHRPKMGWSSIPLRGVDGSPMMGGFPYRGLDDHAPILKQILMKGWEFSLLIAHSLVLFFKRV